MEPELYAALDERLRRLERESASLRADLSAAAPALATASAFAAPPVVAAAPAAPSVWAVPPKPDRPAFSFEVFFAGRGLQLVGLVLVLLGAAFFLNLAFTRGWVGPAERIVLGLICGVALIAVGARAVAPQRSPAEAGPGAARDHDPQSVHDRPEQRRHRVEDHLVHRRRHRLHGDLRLVHAGARSHAARTGRVIAPDAGPSLSP
jgi:hypothetical protein